MREYNIEVWIHPDDGTNHITLLDRNFEATGLDRALEQAAKLIGSVRAEIDQRLTELKGSFPVYTLSNQFGIIPIPDYIWQNATFEGLLRASDADLKSVGFQDCGDSVAPELFEMLRQRVLNLGP